MREHEQKVLNKAIKIVDDTINHALHEYDDKKTSCAYLEKSMTEMEGYLSISYRFNGMTGSDYNEGLKMVADYREEVTNRIAQYDKERTV